MPRITHHRETGENGSHKVGRQSQFDPEKHAGKTVANRHQIGTAPVGGEGIRLRWRGSAESGGTLRQAVLKSVFEGRL
jgi:hypothetical protein